MRWLGYWAAVIAGTAVLSASGCLTSQDSSDDGGAIEDPPITIEKGGSSTGQGGGAGDATGGSGKGGSSRGGRAGGSGTGNGDGGSDSGCNDDTDCESRFDGRTRCSVATGECVDCLSVTDCESDEECVNNICRPITTCPAGECPNGLVCNPTTERCEQCVGSNGCAADETCVSNVCRKSCTSDTQCIFFGMRCNTGSGYCVSCVGDSDCPENRNCQQGSCVLDICEGGTASCEGNNIVTCNASGSVLTNPIPCGAQQSCSESGSTASCQPWICQPSTTGCSLTSERVVTCSADGLRETLVEDCEAMEQLCIGTTNGMCSDSLCEPYTRFCQGNTIQTCDATGTMSTLYQTCSTNQQCNPATTMCAIPLCTPNQPACNGNVYTTCNSTGFGYTAGGTDCSATMEFCGATGCTTSAVDTIPASPTLYTSPLPNYTMINLYSVTGSRTLSRIEVYMNPASAMTITWLVYEATTLTGTYTNISTTTTTSTTGVGYQSSGTLAVPLVAGRFYGIGIAWGATSLTFGYQQTTASQTTSFGALSSFFIVNQGTAPTTFVGPASSGAFIPERLTTTP